MCCLVKTMNIIKCIYLYLLNTQLVQDIIKNMYTHRNEKKDIKHSGKSIHT